MHKSLQNDDIDEFNLIITDIENNDTVKLMKNFKQHYDTSCYDHCRNVAFYSYLICRKFNLDFEAAARSGMLHDLFLYDWHEKRVNRKGLHGFTHPRTALDNSNKLFILSDKEQDIILKHMWPITIVLPKYKESYIVSCVDKFCALKESYEHYKRNKRIQKMYRYAYVFLSLVIFRIF